MIKFLREKFFWVGIVEILIYTGIMLRLLYTTPENAEINGSPIVIGAIILIFALLLTFILLCPRKEDYNK